MRNYSYSHHEIDQRDEFIIKLDPLSNKAEYLPIGFKLALLKKKRMMQLSQEDERAKEKSKPPHFALLAPRGQISGEFGDTISSSLKK